MGFRIWAFPRNKAPFWESIELGLSFFGVRVHIRAPPPIMETTIWGWGLWVKVEGLGQGSD